jgi:SAM-dependent methyltransferase
MREQLRKVFDEDADLYTRARPGYPAALFADLAALTGLRPGARVLEIGPGTGQATFALAGLGARVTAIELGPELAAALRRRAPAGIDVQVGAFEDWPLPAEPFDVVASFTAWHWLDPAVRSSRVAAALSPTGSLATVTTSHVRGGTEAFFDAAQDCYRRWDPATEPGVLLQTADAIAPATDEVDGSAAFRAAVRRRYRQDISYSTAGYLDLLNTYSGHRALTPERRAGLLSDLGKLIDERFGGTVTKSYLYELRVAGRRPPGT